VKGKVLGKIKNGKLLAAKTNVITQRNALSKQARLSMYIVMKVFSTKVGQKQQSMLKLTVNLSGFCTIAICPMA
jgi:hypothetical protein